MKKLHQTVDKNVLDAAQHVQALEYVSKGVKSK
jgi:hypothetical protein